MRKGILCLSLKEEDGFRREAKMKGEGRVDSVSSVAGFQTRDLVRHHYFNNGWLAGGGQGGFAATHEDGF
jgi:hypothetical protein